jgi:tetratricopeptide (TPR) repeat protein
MREGTVFAERFVVEGLAGSGGMGEVYRASDRTTGEPVALKVMHVRGGSPERFLREGRVLADLNVPGVVRYVAHGLSSDNRPYLAMEWLDGEELAHRLARGGLTVRESVLVVRATAEALAPAHARGVIHRDLKPSNVFLVGGELARPKILDFGLARYAQGTGGTLSGVLVGTPAYMAPEQARGERDLDARVDVFALGCVFFECLTGRAPFVGEHPIAILTRILMSEPPRVRELRQSVPAAVDGLVARMLEKDRARRPRDAQHVIDLIDALGAVETGELGPPSTERRALTSSERRLVSVVLASVAEPEAEPSHAETVAQDQASEALEQLRAAVQPFGAELERLADGTYVATVTAQGTATDQAARAARCALALKEHLPEASFAISTGQGEVASRLPVGEAAERAATLLTPGRKAITLDETTAALLDARFVVSNARELSGARDDAPATRTLLGKATPFVGRDREMATLFAIWEEVLSEPVARAVVVTAGPGVGKSRLRTEMTQRLLHRAPAPEVWIARGDPMSAGAPLGMIARAIRGAAGLVDGEPLAAKREKLRARVAARLPPESAGRVTAFLGELAGVPFDDEGSVQLRAARQDRQLMSDQIRLAFEDFVAAETRARPLLLVLDDLHWGDLSSVKLVDAALRNLADRPWMVLALGRPMIHDLFGLPWAERGAQEIRLGEVSRKAAERLVREVLGDRADAEIVERVVGLAAGNAFFLEELIRAVAEGRRERLPDTVLGMVQARFDGLPLEARRLLRAASVFGQTFPAEGLETLLGEPQEQVFSEWLRHLVEGELLVKRSGSEKSVYAFRHALVQEAAYAALTDADRKLGHRLAAEWLERGGGSDPSTIADHYQRGGEPARSIEFFRRAAEQALKGDDLAAALAHAERGIACGAHGERLGALLLLESEALVWRGDFRAASTQASRAFELLGAGTPDWYRAAGIAALAKSTSGDAPGFLLIADAIEARPPADENAVGPYVVALAHIATRMLYLGRYRELSTALAAIDGAVASRDREASTYGGWIEDAHSTRAMADGDMAGCLKRMEAAAALFDATGDRRNACRERGHVGYAYMELGCYEEARAALSETVATARRMGLNHVAANAMHNLGSALGRAGLLDEALSVERQAVAELEAQRDERLWRAARCYLSEILLAYGSFEEAERIAREAATTESEKPIHAICLAAWSNALRALGRVEDALARSKEAYAILGELGSLEDGESKVALAHVEALLAAGRAEEARAVAVTARKRVLETASRISVPAWRESFLTRIAENVRLQELGRTSNLPRS